MHDLSHSLVHTTRKLISVKFVWNGLQKQVGIWAKQCICCQTSQRFRHTSSPLLRSSVFPGAILTTFMWIWRGHHHLPVGSLTCSQYLAIFLNGQKPSLLAIPLPPFHWIVCFSIPLDIVYSSLIALNIHFSIIRYPASSYHILPPPVHWPHWKISSSH